MNDHDALERQVDRLYGIVAAFLQLASAHAHGQVGGEVYATGVDTCFAMLNEAIAAIEEDA